MINILYLSIDVRKSCGFDLAILDIVDRLKNRSFMRWCILLPVD